MQEAIGPPTYQSVNSAADSPAETPDHAVSGEAGLSGNVGNNKSKNKNKKKK